MHFFPLIANLNGRRCLAVGSGSLIEEKAETLRKCGAVVRRNNVFIAEEAEDVFLILADVDESIAAQIRTFGERHRVFVNIVDKPEYCSFIVPAIARRNDLLITVSTSGKSPSLASWIRERLETEFGPEYQELIEALGSTRGTVKTELDSYGDRKAFYRALFEGGILQLAAHGGKGAVRDELRRQLDAFKKRAPRQTRT